MNESETPITDMIRRLMSRGLSPEGAIEEATIFERATSRSSVVINAGREYERIRKANYRSAKKNVPTESPENVPGHDVEAISSSRDNSLNLMDKEEDIAAAGDVPDNPGQEAEPKKPKRDNGTRLPTDWTPSEDLVAYGEKLGLTRQEVLSCGEEMRLWATANSNRANARKSNWAAAFQGWVRRETPKIIRNRPRRPNNSNGETNAQNRSTGGFSTIAARLRQDLATRETVDLRSADPEPPHRH